MKLELSEEFYRCIAEMEEPEGGVFACSPEIYSQMTKEIPMMRAKLAVESVTRYGQSEVLKMRAVPKSTAYPDDGSDEDNTYAKWSPQGELTLTVANPALHGKFNPGDKFYVDFTPAE